MYLSHTLSLRELQIPVQFEEPEVEVTDAWLDRVVSVCGGYQREIRLPRCTALTPSGLASLALCEGLRKLDLSHTSVARLGFVEGTSFLTVLRLVGCLDVRDLSPLTALEHLRTLSLRYTKVRDIEPLAQCLTLADIDLGCTDVDDVSALAHCEDLQTLYLDTSRVTDISPISELSKVVMVNVGLTQVDPDKVSLRSNGTVSGKARLMDWMQAVVAGDEQSMRALLSQGQSVNERAHPHQNQWLMRKWELTCPSPTRFFNAAHPDEKLRPTAAHLCVFFGHDEALMVLNDFHADLKALAWFGEYTPIDIERAECKADMVSTQGMLRIMTEEHTYRSVYRMIEQGWNDWRTRCQMKTTDIRRVLNEPARLAKEKRLRKEREEAERQRLIEEELARRTGGGVAASAPAAGGDGDGGAASGSGGEEQAGKPTNSDQGTEDEESKRGG